MEIKMPLDTRLKNTKIINQTLCVLIYACVQNVTK